MVDRNPGWKLQVVIGSALFAWTGLTYASVVHHDFVNYDDLHLVVHNPTLTRPATLSNLLSHFGPTGAGNSNWLPLYWISLQLGFALHGSNPTAFLITNVLLHAASAVLLFAALRRLTGAVGRSAFVAAVFAVHPLHVESVAWVAERKDVLGGFFWMLGLLAYARFVEAPRSKARYAAVFACLALGLLCKSTLVTFPAVLLLLDLWPLGRLRAAPRRVLLEKLPLFLLAAAASVATVVSQQANGNLAIGAAVGFGSRLANAVESYWAYLGDAFWPTGLAVLYPHPYLLTPVSGRAALAGALLAIAGAGLTALLLAASRKRPALGVGWLWFIGVLVPMIGLLQVGVQARADRYTYLPLVGLSITVAWGATELLGAKRRKLAAALGLAAVLALTAATRRQLEHWVDSVALFERAVAVTERNHYAHERLAFELLERGRIDEARAHYLAALEFAPTYGPLHYGVALTYEREGNVQAAIAAHRAALRVTPGLALSHGSLGLLLLRDGRPAAARRHLRFAADALPGSPEYREALVEAERELGITRPIDPPH